MPPAVFRAGGEDGIAEVFRFVQEGGFFVAAERFGTPPQVGCEKLIKEPAVREFAYGGTDEGDAPVDAVIVGIVD